jgi:hypothetical protein
MVAAMIISDRADIFLLYALSAFLHELGHISAAKLMKIEIKEIKFDFSHTSCYNIKYIYK